MKLVLDRNAAIAFARVTGFLDTEQVLRLSANIDDGVSDWGDRAALHCRLIDLTEAKVASPSSIEELAREIRNPARKGVYAKRVAYFGASPLLRLQIERLCALREGLAQFSDLKSAHEFVKPSFRS